MRFLDDVLWKTEEYRTIERSVSKGATPCMATGLAAIHKAHLIYTLCRRLRRKALVLAADESEAARLCEDITQMGLKALYYPARDFTYRDVAGVSGEFTHQRIGALFQLITGKCDILVACIDGALQYTIPPEVLQENTAVIRAGTEISPEKLTGILINGGYVRSEQVESSGQFAVRGGIVDIFMPSSEKPYRIEFWGDEIDNISEFDPETQRRTDTVESFYITPSNEILIEDQELLAEKILKKAKSLRDKNASNARALMTEEAEKIRESGRISCIDKYYSMIYDTPATLYDYFKDNELVFVSEQPVMKDKLKGILYQWTEDLADYYKEGVLCRGLDHFMGEWQQHLDALSMRDTIFVDNFARGSCELPLRELVNFTAKQVSSWGGSLSILCEDLESWQGEDKICIVLAGTEKNAENVFHDLQARGMEVSYLRSNSEIEHNGIYIAPGGLSGGFEYPAAGFALITHTKSSSSGSRKHKRQKKNTLFSLAELTPGDYVVHSVQGIGQFIAIQKHTVHGITRDYIVIRYAGDDMLYVPVTQLDMIAKYIGPKEDSTVKLSKLGGGEWQKSKKRVRKAVKDIADQLIKMYSDRMCSKGYSFPEDNEWQRDFENRFEYDETDDQQRCIDEIKADMERAVPMDRLLCGDVGFGKTEVALRAAFKCVTDGKQCALLVPTTILAWQHYQTILRRFEGYPIKVELLSRFRTPKQQQEIIEKIRRGDIDMVVGTHRLIQKDIRFRDIGLFIIDEEQRFGVEQKENFKSLYKNVDILTLSATPIPRTLNMAMSGIRDMSTIEEAPQDRHPVQSYVLEYDDAVIHEAIRRELRRGGQVFYLYNRVNGIERKAQELAKAVPEAKVGFGHGKMTEAQLSEVWRQMLEGEINLLVCTTIIETGVDIPNANTLIIEDADRMGLSQLHQIRGRVGRSTRRAYAYFTFRANKAVSEISQKRLEAIREFTEFGSGFKIAMRDLEIRGAGNMLGAMQHGHMTDVGYDMYMKLLNEAISTAKGEPVRPEDRDCVIDIQVDAHIPESYISNLDHRLAMYRRIADIRTMEDCEDVIDEMIDRFGDMPRSVSNLTDIALIRSKAQQIGVIGIRQHDNMLQLIFEEIRCEGAANIIVRMKGRAKLNMTAKPYIGMTIQPGESIVKLLNLVFAIK